VEYRDLVARARASITEIDVDELAARLADRPPLLVDVREADEHALGAIPGSVLIPRGTLESTLPSQASDRATPIVLYCAVGNRSALAAVSLAQMGYRTVASLAGGFAAWKAAGHGWRRPPGLDAEQRARYSRHLLLPEVGAAGQQRLLEARVLMIGAGGLGSPAALYLAAAGVGAIGIVDDDAVDLSNLQRQILHNVDRIGRLKVDSARETLQGLNPEVKVEPYATRLHAGNALELMTGYDVVVDGADNFPTRYLVNDASLHVGTPVVHGSVFRFEGQATVFRPYEGPCYRCLYRLPPPPELAPACGEAGVMGVVPGVVGSVQAVEAIKLLLGMGSTLEGRLLTYDALEQDFRTLRLRRDPACPACSDPGAPPALVDYAADCSPVR
jgi:molybdopterin/thiamine biosynthesis adenylyltransferase/rhodanese-related sulfurtransferase